MGHIMSSSRHTSIYIRRVRLQAKLLPTRLSNTSLIVASLCLPSIPVQAAQLCLDETTMVRVTAEQENLCNGNVVDQRTGLMWAACDAGLAGNGCETGSVELKNWQQALQYVESLNVSGGLNGFSDWRLPSIKELNALTEPACINPSYSLQAFTDQTDFTPEKRWWTATPAMLTSEQLEEGVTTSADGFSWALDSASGAIAAAPRTDALRVRLVRTTYSYDAESSCR